MQSSAPCNSPTVLFSSDKGETTSSMKHCTSHVLPITVVSSLSTLKGLTHECEPEQVQVQVGLNDRFSCIYFCNPSSDDSDGKETNVPL